MPLTALRTVTADGSSQARELAGKFLERLTDLRSIVDGSAERQRALAEYLITQEAQDESARIGIPPGILEKAKVALWTQIPDANHR